MDTDIINFVKAAFVFYSFILVMTACINMSERKERRMPWAQLIRLWASTSFWISVAASIMAGLIWALF